MSGTAVSYESSPTPSRAFPALKTPPPEDDSVDIGEEAIARSLGRIERRMASNLDSLLALSAKMLRRRRDDEAGAY